MIVFPHAKINLGLNVVRKRPDGFHDVETVMMPVPWHDVLEVLLDRSLRPGEVVFSRTGLEVTGPVQDDLCWRAAALFGEVCPLPGIRLHLHKNIPMGAGLGGGSSDAAHVLMLLDQLCDAPLGHAELARMAGQLGSDCPFFLRHEVQVARSRGEILSPFKVDLKGLHLLVVVPPIHVSTATAYGTCRPSGGSIDLPELLATLPRHQWISRIPNTLEENVMSLHPRIAGIKEELLKEGAFHAAMSGSGAAVYGLFENEPARRAWPTDHRIGRFHL